MKRDALSGNDVIMPPVLGAHLTIHGGDLMKRLVLTFVGLGTFVAFTAGPALAFQCPKLIGQINGEAGRRFDATAYDAKMKAAEAQKLHAEGKHAESEKLAKETVDRLGLK